VVGLPAHDEFVKTFLLDFAKWLCHYYVFPIQVHVNLYNSNAALSNMVFEVMPFQIDVLGSHLVSFTVS
jgi:hypothetical protein